MQTSVGLRWSSETLSTLRWVTLLLRMAGHGRGIAKNCCFVGGEGKAVGDAVATAVRRADGRRHRVATHGGVIA